MATLKPHHRAHPSASDIDMDDFDVDLTLSGTPMIQDNLEDFDDMNYNEVTFTNVQEFNILPEGSPHSVAMGTEELPFIADEQLLDYAVASTSDGTLPGQTATANHAEDLPDVQSNTFTASWNPEVDQDLTVEHAPPQHSQPSPVFSASPVTSINQTATQDGRPHASEDREKPLVEHVDESHASTTGDHSLAGETEVVETKDDEFESIRNDEVKKQNMTSPTDTPRAQDAKARSPDVASAVASDPEIEEALEQTAPQTSSVNRLESHEKNNNQSFETQEYGSGQPMPSHALHPVIVEWQKGEQDWLFRPAADEERQSFYLEDASLASQSYSTLFQELRLAIADDISADEEIEIEISAFDISVREDSCDDHSTFADLINIYLQLQGIDGVEQPEPLGIKLHRRPRFSARLAQLQEAIIENKGLSQLDFLNTASNGSSDFDDRDSQYSQDGNHSDHVEHRQHFDNLEPSAQEHPRGAESFEERSHAQEDGSNGDDRLEVTADVTDFQQGGEDDLVDYDDLTDQRDGFGEVKTELDGSVTQVRLETMPRQAVTVDERTGEEAEHSHPSEYTVTENDTVSEENDQESRLVGHRETEKYAQDEANELVEDETAYLEADEYEKAHEEAYHGSTDLDVSGKTEEVDFDQEENYADGTADLEADDEPSRSSFVDEDASFDDAAPVMTGDTTFQDDQDDEAKDTAELPELYGDDLIDYDDEETAAFDEDATPSSHTIQDGPSTPIATVKAYDFTTSPSSKRPRDESLEEEPLSASGLKRQKSGLDAE